VAVRAIVQAELPLRGALRLEMIGAAAPDRLAAIRPVVDAILACGAAGGFCPPRIAPNNSWLGSTGPMLAAGSNIELPLEAYEVDPRFVRLLQATLLRRPDLSDGAPDLFLRQLYPPRNEPLRHLPDCNADNEEILYPEASERPGFVVEVIDDTDSWMRHCMVELEEPCEPAIATALGDWIESWGCLLELGAFALPYDDPEEGHSIMGKVAQFDAWSIEIGVDRFDANFAAWSVLTNLLGTFSATRHRIASILIE
jgi:hypothetical protein